MLHFRKTSQLLWKQGLFISSKYGATCPFEVLFEFDLQQLLSGPSLHTTKDMQRLHQPSLAVFHNFWTEISTSLFFCLTEAKICDQVLFFAVNCLVALLTLPCKGNKANLKQHRAQSMLLYCYSVRSKGPLTSGQVHVCVQQTSYRGD